MSILGLCLIVLGTVFSFFGTYSSNKESQNQLTSKIQEKNQVIEDINQNNIRLIDQNSTLLSSNNDVSQTNKDLIEKNNEMLEKIAKYQTDIEARNQIISELEKEVDNVKRYSFYADYNIYGSTFNTKAKGGISFTSDLINRMDKLLFDENEITYVIPDLKNLPLVDDVIKRYPDFPFGYYVKYQLLKNTNQDGWITYAKKAKEIFLVTTSISGHNGMHDNALKNINNDLKSKNAL